MILIALVAFAGVDLAACGARADNAPRSGTVTAVRGAATPTQPATPGVTAFTAAQQPLVSAFPRGHGRSLASLARLGDDAGLQFGAATGTFTPGVNRIAFGLNAATGAFVYAPTALYVARAPGAPARGPFPAPSDPLTILPAYRSHQDTGPGEIRAIYAAEVPLPGPGTWDVVTLTRLGGRLLRATGQVTVAARSPVPRVDQRPPGILTDTLQSTRGNLRLLTTRLPPEAMHAVALRAVLGHRPVALLFSTPQLCASRVCGPVTDVLVQLQRTYGARIAFIHQEVYVANDPRRGLRPQMSAFHLQTEPWLFTIGRSGRIAARLEGTFGLTGARRALEAALR